MHSVALLQAKVQLLSPKSNRRPKTLSFKIHPQRSPILTDTLMSNFSHLKLSEYEKRSLTKWQRQEISFYRLTPTKEISQCAHQLVKEINKLKGNQITIKACDFGTFVCLAAIFSGKIDRFKNIHFELALAPLKFFPKDLVDKKNVMNSKMNVTFKSKSDCWLKNFESLIWEQEITDLFHFSDEEDDFSYEAA